MKSNKEGGRNPGGLGRGRKEKRKKSRKMEITIGGSELCEEGR